MIFGFAVFLVAGISTISVLGFPDRPPRGVLLLAWVAMLGSAAVALWSAHVWSRVILVFFGPAVIKMIAILLIGDDAYFASHSMTRTDGWEALAYIVTVVLLTSRFVGRRPAMTTIFDRIALAALVWTLFVQVTVTYRFPPVPLLSGLAALFVAWWIDYSTHQKHKHRRKQVHGGPVMPIDSAAAPEPKDK